MWIAIVVGWAVCAVAAGLIARAKHFSVPAWYLVASFLGPLALLMAIIRPAEQPGFRGADGYNADIHWAGGGGGFGGDGGE